MIGWKLSRREPVRWNWAMVRTLGGKSKSEKRWESEMDEKLAELKRKWYSDEPPIYPIEELSVMVPDDVLYIAHYEEGIVLRLNDDPGQVTFLTNDMANELAQKIQKKPQA
jgi:hypothetical protein